MTYKEMNRRSNQLARKLRSLGVGCNESVAMYCQRSPEMLVGIMAILKAGGCYLPIDPKCPIERRDYMLDFSRVRVVLTDHSCPGLEKQGLEIIALDEAANYSGKLPIWLLSIPRQTLHMSFIHRVRQECQKGLWLSTIPL